jgi:hypothetical protein
MHLDAVLARRQFNRASCGGPHPRERRLSRQLRAPGGIGLPAVAFAFWAMADGDDNPLSIILADLRARLDARVRGAGEVAARLRSLAARYNEAVTADSEAELARRQGKHAPPPDPSPAQIAAELFDFVATLPELQNDGDEQQDQPTPTRSERASSGPVSFAELMSSAEHPQPEPARPSWPEQPHPHVLQLVDDFRSHDLDALQTPMFRALAEELAARARLLQEQGATDPDKSTDYVIRALTSVAHKRGVRIFGLAHHHQANWQERADQGRRQQEKLRATPPRPKRAPSPKRQDDEGEDEKPREPWDLPRLRVHAGVVVIIGGVVKPEKLDRLREHLGFEVEWIETTMNGTGSTAALERRIRDRHVAAVIVLDGLISHKHSQQIVDAARQTDVPLAYGGTAGIGKLKEAFEQLEACLP